MVNFGNMSIADLRLGATQVQAAYLGNRQVWSLGPVVPKYDVKSIGRSVSEQGTSIEISEQAGETITLYIRTNATDLTGKQVCAAVYTAATDVTPYATFAFGNVSLSGRYITGTTPDVSAWVPSGFPDTYDTLYMKTWIQDAGGIDPADALGEVLDWTGEDVYKPTQLSPFRLTARQPNSAVQLNVQGAVTPHLQYSVNGGAYADLSAGQTVSLSGANDYVEIKATQDNTEYTDSNFCQFSLTGAVEATGNFGSLIHANQQDWNSLYNRCFYRLFNLKQNLVNAKVNGDFSYVYDSDTPGPFQQAFKQSTSLSSIEFTDLSVAGGGASHGSAGAGIFVNAFCDNATLKRVSFPEVTSLCADSMWAAFERNTGMLSVLFPKLKNMNPYAFWHTWYYCPSMRVIDFSGFESVPQLGDTFTWTSLPSQCSVIIPDALYDEWTTTTNWSSLPCQYVKKSEFGS